jgi:hypothetical protein
MADKTYVSIKCDVKSIFDNAFKSAALEALKDAITTAVDGHGDFTTSAKSKVTIVLTSAVTSLTADDKEKPSSLEVKISIDGLLTGGTAAAFKASSAGSADGFNPKKVKEQVGELVDAVAASLMKSKVLPQMVKMIP